MTTGESADRIYDKIAGMAGLAAKAGRIVKGARACEEAAARGRILVLLMPGDAADNTAAGLRKVCGRYGVPVLVFGEMETFGKITGKDGIAAIGVTESSFASRIMELYKQL